MNPEVYLIQEAYYGSLGAKDVLATLRSEDGDKPSKKGLQWLRTTLQKGGEVEYFARCLARNFGVDLRENLE